VGKAQTRKGKRLFMPIRIALTGRMSGPDVGDVLCMLRLDAGDVAPGAGYVPLSERLQQLRTAVAEL
jgi:glutamyl-tRNA synthetase